MAEGFSRVKLNKKFKIYSAGVEAHGLNTNAIEVMNEIGIDISTQKSKSIVADELSSYDLVITLCGDARDRCPVLSGWSNHIHWNLQDPAKASGSEDDILRIYRKIRDQISKNINSLL